MKASQRVLERHVFFERLLRDEVSRESAEPWEWALVSFSAALCIGVLVLVFSLICLHCKSRPPRVIASQGCDQDKDLPANETGSISSCSDVTSPDENKDIIAIGEDGEENRVLDDIESVPDWETSASHATYDGESVDIWDYSVRSGVATTVCGASVSEYTNSS